jgi:polyisoprenoid-binding protein YceI
MFLITDFALGEVEKWEIDKAHSNIYFDVRHTYVTVRGKFKDFSGVLKFNPDNLAVSSVSFQVNTKSINTGVPNRDNHLRSEEFFAVNKYPAMTFQSIGVKQKEGNQYTLPWRAISPSRARPIKWLFRLPISAHGIIP